MSNAAEKKVSSTEELQEVFRQAQEKKTPVSLYRKAQAGEIELDFSEWKEIEKFDIDNLMVIFTAWNLAGKTLTQSRRKRV